MPQDLFTRLRQLYAVAKKYSISNTHLFTFDPKPGFDLYTRDFAPTESDIAIRVGEFAHVTFEANLRLHESWRDSFD